MKLIFILILFLSIALTDVIQKKTQFQQQQLAKQAGAAKSSA